MAAFVTEQSCIQLARNQIAADRHLQPGALLCIALVAVVGFGKKRGPNSNPTS